MKAQTWLRVRDLFERALDLPAAERPGFVAASEGDPTVRAEVLRLLESERDEGDYLKTPAPGALRAFDGWRPAPGDMVGGYRLESRLGAGGMGTVYAARQERPSRLVALKVLHGADLSLDARRRFELEGEVLGRLNHPGIAAIHELGIHSGPDGAEVPFIAMERIEGARDLVSCAREERLDLRARLALLREVCAAVEHAHQKGVIHRDLKPANVLVDAHGRPKVIDYGVARLTEAGPADRQHTLTGMVLGTLQYMSPEQVGGSSRDVDTRSDVYALGVILYELLAGRPPREVHGVPLVELVERICNEAPPPPSRHRPGLPAELDWIAVKALEIDRERRYPSAAALAEDLERFLRHEPVQAAPPTRAYRVRKFVARNRVLVSLATAAVLSLAAGIVATSLQAVRANEQAALARTESEAANRALRRQQAVVGSLESIFSAVQPTEDGRRVTLFELLERRRSKLDEEFADDPELRGHLQVFLGSAYDALGLHETGEHLLEAAIDTLAGVPGFEPRRLAWLRVQLARVRQRQARLKESQALFEASLPVLEQQYGEDSFQLLEAQRMHASLLAQLGDTPGAIRALRRVVDRSAEVFGPDGEKTLMAMSQLARQLSVARRYLEAEELARETRRRAVDTVGEDHPMTGFITMELSQTLHNRRKYAEAAELQRDLLARVVELFGEHHRNATVDHMHLSVSLARAGDCAEALAHADRAVELAGLHHAGNPELRFGSRKTRAEVRAICGGKAEALEELRGVVTELESALGPSHSHVLVSALDLALLELAAGEWEPAEERLRSLLPVLAASRPGERSTTVARALLGLALHRGGRAADAADELTAALDAVAGWSEEALRLTTDPYLEPLREAAAAAGREDLRLRIQAALDAGK